MLSFELIHIRGRLAPKKKVCNFVRGVISPILANIYLHELDCYVAKLISRFEKGEKRAANPEYKKGKGIVGWLNRKREQEQDPVKRVNMLEQKKEVHRHMLTIPSQNQH